MARKVDGSEPRKRKKAVKSYPVIMGVPDGRPSGGKGKRVTTFRFGSVAAKSSAPHPDVKSANIAAGQQALMRAKGAFTKRGVSLRHRKDVPVFFADPNEPSVLIRRLDGKEERGRIVAGAFVPAE